MKLSRPLFEEGLLQRLGLTAKPTLTRVPPVPNAAPRAGRRPDTVSSPERQPAAQLSGASHGETMAKNVFECPARPRLLSRAPGPHPVAHSDRCKTSPCPWPRKPQAAGLTPRRAPIGTPCSVLAPQLQHTGSGVRSAFVIQQARRRPEIARCVETRPKHGVSGRTRERDPSCWSTSNSFATQASTQGRDCTASSQPASPLDVQPVQILSQPRIAWRIAWRRNCSGYYTFFCHVGQVLHYQ